MSGDSQSRTTEEPGLTRDHRVQENLCPSLAQVSKSAPKAWLTEQASEELGDLVRLQGGPAP